MAYFAEFSNNSPVIVTSFMFSENHFDDPNILCIADLTGSSLGCMVMAAERNLKNLAYAPDAMAAALLYALTHLTKLFGICVPRIIAAYFKMSFFASSHSIWLNVTKKHKKCKKKLDVPKLVDNVVMLMLSEMLQQTLLTI